MTLDGRQPLTKDDLWRKTTFDGSWPLTEDDLWRKTTFDKRWPLTEYYLWRKTIFDGRWRTITQGGTRPISWNETEKLDQQNSIRDQDREKVDADLFNETRPRRDCLIFICPRWDLTQNSGWDRESRCLFLRDQDDNHHLMKKMIEFWYYYFLNKI